MARSTRRQVRAAVALVLEHAERNPGGPLPYEVLPQVRAAFGDRRELLLALQWSWSQQLWTLIENHPAAGTVTAGQAAWTECARRNPVLRRLLDQYADELGGPPAALPAALPADREESLAERYEPAAERHACR